MRKVPKSLPLTESERFLFNAHVWIQKVLSKGDNFDVFFFS